MSQPVKDKKSLAAAAKLENHPGGWVILTFVDHDGGDFQLVPKTDGDSLFLADASLPKYLLQVRGESPATLRRVGNAILSMARTQEEALDQSPSPDDEA